LKLALDKLEIPSVVASQDGVPDPFADLPGAAAIITTPPQRSFDTGVAIECSTPDRAGVFAPKLADSKTLINIDHHLSNTEYGHINYWDTTAAAVGELLDQVIRALGGPIDAAIAQALLTAIVTDTGSFRFSSVTAQTLRIAANLLEAGAAIQPIVERVYETKTLAGMRLLGGALAAAQVSPDGQVIWTGVTPELLAMTGARSQDTTGIVGTLRQVQGVRVAILFEVAADGVRVSIRSRDGVRANVIAEALGGGGHVAAAGFTMAGPVSEVIAKTLALVHAELANSPPGAPRPMRTA
jgi:phosphoesterase RecJ-like protein